VKSFSWFSCMDVLPYFSFFQSLTSICPIFKVVSCYIFKTLNTISTASIFCGHTIHTFHVVLTQYAVSEQFPQCLHFLNRQAIPPNKIMDCFCSIYKCSHTPFQNSKNNIPNLRYSIKTSASAMISVHKQYISADNKQNNWIIDPRLIDPRQSSF